MKFTAAIAIAALAAVSASTTREKHEEMFLDHMQKYELEFKDGAEFVQRLEVFIENIKYIEEHNADSKKTYTMGQNQFTHMTFSEFKDYNRIGSTRPPNLRRASNKIHGEPTTANPASVNWATAGAVTPVKNQGQCGSCWSFSTTGGLEGAYFLKQGNLVSFSEQELVSCDSSDSGCNGGWMDAAFTWIQNNGGLATEATYPYTSGAGVTGSCPGTGNSVPNSAPSSFTDVQAGSVSALESAVAQQPVSVAIQANQRAFQTYSGGVMTGTCGQSLDHGVLAVGYGTSSDGIDYWLVKNSWGPTWGDNGYIMIEKSSADKCGILLSASYPNM